MMTEKEKFLHLGPMIPFCCQAGVSADRESNMASCGWSGAEGHATTRRSRGRGSTSEELPAFPHQIKSSVKTHSSSAFSWVLRVCLCLNCFCLAQGGISFSSALNILESPHTTATGPQAWPRWISLACCTLTHIKLLVNVVIFLLSLQTDSVQKIPAAVVWLPEHFCSWLVTSKVRRAAPVWSLSAERFGKNLLLI